MNIELDLGPEFKKAEKDITERLLYTARTEHRYESRTKNLEKATKVTGNITGTSGYGLSISVDTVRAPYAKFIIKGTGKWEADPFLEDAVKSNEEWIYARLQEAIDESVRIQNNRR